MKLYPSKSVKYLGIYLDEHLNGSAHIDILIHKLRRATGMIAKIRHYTLPDQTKSIYHAIFGSHMTYGCQIWGQTFIESYFNKIFKKNAMRLLSCAQYFRDHVSPIYTNFNLLKIKDLIDLKYILFIHDYLNNKLSSSFERYISIREKNKDNCEVTQATSRIVRWSDPLLDSINMNLLNQICIQTFIHITIGSEMWTFQENW